MEQSRRVFPFVTRAVRRNRYEAGQKLRPNRDPTAGASRPPKWVDGGNFPPSRFNVSYIVDAKRRSTLPQGVRPGDSVDYVQLGPDRWELRRLRPAVADKPRLVKRGGVKVITGVKVTRADIVAAIQADRDERENLF